MTGNASDTNPPEAIPARTTPTWEMELLLSGALVYSLMQLPGVLDRWTFGLLPQVSESFQSVIIMISIYLRAGMVALAAAFVVHLMLRAWWVALVGVNSVFPGGPRWERMRQGPLNMERLQRLWRPLPVRIEQMDNAASIVFATGVSLGLLMLSLALAVGVMTLLGSALGHFRVFGLSDKQWVLVIAAVLLLPQTLGSMLDLRQRGHPQAAHSRLNRLIRPMIAMQGLFPGMASASTLINTLLSNLLRRGTVVVAVLVMSVAIVLSSLSTPILSARLFAGPIAPVTAGALVSRAVNYRDQRKSMERLAAVPTLASQELGEAPLRLFMPLRRDRHPTVLKTHCPELLQTPAKDPGNVHTQALLDCLHQWAQPLLDGQPLPEHARIFSVDPQSGLSGVLWRVPNAAISAGPHVLTLRTRDDPADTDEPAKPLDIVFFK